MWRPALILCLLGSSAFAEHAPRISEGGTLSVTFENDVFAGTDKNYTNGGRIAYVTPRNELGMLGRAARDNLGWLTDADDWYAIYAIGQTIFTPEDITRRPPDRTDRPYAGFTFVSFGVSADRGDRLDTVLLDIGVVGELSQADDVQRAVHDVIDSDDPRGWDFQLKNEPAVRLVYDRKYRFGHEFDLDLFDLEVDAAPNFGVTLGNVDTFASGGLTVRIGDELTDSYGPPRIRPSIAAPGFFRPEAGVGWYLFAGGEARAVARNIFLEGNSFRNSANVEPHRFVADLRAGLALQFRSVELAYTHVFRSPEFRGQEGFAQFGSLTVSTKF